METILQGKIIDNRIAGHKTVIYGRIHSVFANSFNIESSHLHNINAGEDISSMGISIMQSDLSGIEKGDLVIWKNNRIQIHGNRNYVIDLNRCIPIDTKIKTISERQYNRLFSFLNKMDLTKKIGLHLDNQLLDTINQPINISSRFLLGRGIGLTPAGDDMICGRFFVDEIVGDKEEKISFESSITNRISQEILEQAQQGYFSSKVVKLREDLISNKDIEPTIRKILNHGHTSGADFLFGAYQRLKMIIDRNDPH